jgi:hypothetical protein
MGDIKRNKVDSTPTAEPIVTSEVTKAPAAGNFVKRESLQVHFGNVEGLKLKLLENISLGIQVLCDLMDPEGTKRIEIQRKREEKNG